MSPYDLYEILSGFSFLVSKFSNFSNILDTNTWYVTEGELVGYPCGEKVLTYWPSTRIEECLKSWCVTMYRQIL